MFIIISFICAITGMFNSIFIFTIIILIHEFGHFITAFLFKWNLDKIEIYPYGGCTKFNNSLNVSIFEEFMVLISGPLFQIIFYFLIKDYLTYNDYILFRDYNFTILYFNLIPIYPLDGGRLLNLIFSIFLSYKKSLIISIYISFILCVFIFCYIKSFTFYLIIIFLIVKVFDEYSKIKFYYNKFLLERYMNNLSYKDLKIIDNVNNFYRSKRHLIKKDGKYYSEKEFLYKYFKV